MDLHRAIKGLRAEKKKVEQVIASIKELQRAAGLLVPRLRQSAGSAADARP